MHTTGTAMDRTAEVQLRVAVMPGDGIGPEIVPQAVRVVEAALTLEPAVEVSFEPQPVGWTSYLEHGHTLPDGTLDALSTYDGLILGPIGHARYPNRPQCVNPHPIIRKHLDLFANLRPARSYSTLPHLHPDVDVLVVRENNEGFQPDRNMVAGSGEFQATDDQAFSLRVITRRQSERIAHAAFRAAQSRAALKRVTAIHKRSVFKLTDGLFMGSVERVAQEYPDVLLNDYQVDTAAMHLVMRPQDFDVILCTNMFGDILSDLTAGLVGGLGMAPALSVGDVCAMAQATHGSAPDIAGQGIANPYAMIASVQMLVEWLSGKCEDPALRRTALRIALALEATISEGKYLTPDLGGTATTEEMGEAVAEAVATADTNEDKG
jgi:3-isopropylmalate dehydrogenase